MEIRYKKADWVRSYHVLVNGEVYAYAHRNHSGCWSARKDRPCRFGSSLVVYGARTRSIAVSALLHLIQLNADRTPAPPVE